MLQNFYLLNQSVKVTFLNIMIQKKLCTSIIFDDFVILFMDDHGWGDVGCNTNGEVKETPHIDKLAASGIRFHDFHVGFSVCTASRGALLTGRSCPRTNICGNFGPDSKHGMSLQEKTVADLLKAADYDTHMIGTHSTHEKDIVNLCKISIIHIFERTHRILRQVASRS